MGFTGRKPLYSPEQVPHFDIISLVVPVIIYKLYQHFFVYSLQWLPPTLLCQYFMIKSCSQVTHILVLFEWPKKWSSFRGNPYSGESAWHRLSKRSAPRTATMSSRNTIKTLWISLLCQP